MKVEEFRSWSVGTLPDLLGIEIDDVERGLVRARLAVRPELMAPNGYLHAAAVIALADTACGYGTMASLPERAKAFTTIELKTNFLGTAHDGVLSCEAKLVHGGRTTQIWDAQVVDETRDHIIALFRCTQLVLYPNGS